MGSIFDKAADVYRDFKVAGVPASGPNDPAKADIRSLFSLVDVAVGAAAAGITIVSTTADRDTFYATEANRGKLVYVNNNNGSATDPANGVYEYVAGAPRIAQSFYQGLATVVQPLVDAAQDAAAMAADEAAAARRAVATFQLQILNPEAGHWANYDGSVLTGDPNWQRVFLSTYPGEEIRYSGSVTAGNGAVAVFYDQAGLFIPNSAVYKGADGVTTTYADLSVFTPSNARYVGFSNYLLTSDGRPSALSIRRLGPTSNFAANLASVERTLSNFEPAVIEVVGGSYFWPDGTFNSNSNYRRALAATRPGEVILYSGATSGGAMAAAIYFDKDGNYLPHSERLVGENGVAVRYTDYPLETPMGAYSIGLSTSIFDAGGFAVTLQIKRGSIASDIAQRVAAIEAGQPFPPPPTPISLPSYWAGKRLAWYGTSIPESGYPLMVGETLGVQSMSNEALGASSARFGVAGQRNVLPGDKYGFKDTSWITMARCLSKTSAEAEDMITNWDTYRPFFKADPPAPAVLDDDTKAIIRDSSWEVRLNRNIAYGPALFVFDHGYNDYFMNPSGTDTGGTSGGSGDLLYLPADTRDRGTFLGAMNYLIDIIMKSNPRARIVFIGHYENDRFANVTQAQEKLAEYWDFPLIRLWKKLGWTQQPVLTTGYWDTAPNSQIWHDTGGPLRTLTPTQIYLKDGVHPYSTPTKQLIADSISGELALLR